ncbi:SIN3-HDAC complex-associated factor-like [Dendronephthya gigantea]|uniref:SIN3-HDAC complex-associated factor-like n=1 Tax=Dendronephthya gigantea TaxID=151771 RepID=UPI00106C9201|nr:SIN3-HDAC complex-associated factor-like [Dendronephthya gigantea]XP_028410245.1 SIN3-HDAC complex-associated factor-like [Dendronephthya gigantea]
MFGSHKPKVYRSSSGCCICGSKSSSSRFTPTEKYENLFTACFNVEQGSRTGLICNACVLLVKRWQKLPKENKRSWSHVVDGKCKSRRGSRRSTSTDERTTAEKSDEKMPNTAIAPNDNDQKGKGTSHRFSDSSTPPSCSPSPSEISDSAIADNGRTSTACQTSFVFPQLMENEMKFPYINLSGWRREEVCCGTIFKGPNGEVLVDPKLLKPYCYCARGQSLVKQNSLEN